MIIKQPSICLRLRSVASFVRPGAFLADIGTDHAQLPIALISEGIAVGAIAADIAPGPLDRARKNISAAGLSDKIKTVLSDGLKEVIKYSPTDITICGMGGETIRDIIAACPQVRDPAVRLICQPQTFAPLLREYLLGEGFSIIDEQLCYDRDKFYVCIVAEFSGKSTEYSAVELLLGRKNIEHGGAVFTEYAKYMRGVLKKKRDGLASAGKNAEETDLIISAIDNYI